MSTTQLPNIGEVLIPVLQRVPLEQQPLLIAIAERLAAQRYREWADAVGAAPQQSELRACADREEEIARRIEALYPGAAATQDAILQANPDLTDLNRGIFAGRPLLEQFTIQAQGERLGAATWRRFAALTHHAAQQAVFQECALLEEQSAQVLEKLLAAPR